MSYISTVIGIQLIIQRLAMKEVNRDKLIAYINKYKIDINTYYHNLQTSNFIEEQYLLAELKSQDIWEVSVWKKNG